MNADIFIRKLQIFAALDANDQLLLQRLLSKKMHVPKGQPFVQVGDVSDNVHILFNGMACRYKILGAQKRQISAFIIPGDLCDPHLLLLGKADHSIIALCDCIIAILPKAHFDEIVLRPNIAKALLFSSLVEESVLREWVGNIGQRNAVQRMAHLFYEIFLRMKSVGLAYNGKIELPINQAELGDSLGLSLVHTNKSLRVLRERKLVEFTSGMLTLLDIEGLKQLCDFDSAYLHLSGDEI